MKAWTDLVTAGLVGTARAPLPPLAGGTPALAALLPGLAGRSAERQLLAGAAVIATWQRAGATAAAPPLALPAAAPPDERGECPPPAASHLARLLGDPALLPLLPEWLAALATAGHVLPHNWLPELLEMAAKSDELCPLILPVIGQRGAWLAAQNPLWASLQLPAGQEAIAAAWSAAPFTHRLSLLRRVRQADPALGRDLVSATWEQEPPREREAFLLALAANAGPEDEPLAEAALDDRRKEVRGAAVALAAALPGSRLCARMAERVRPLLQFQPGEKPGLRNLGIGKKAGLRVTLPETCDRGMQRDGIEPKPQQQAWLGERAWWLAQMLGAVPPETWTQAWPSTAAELVATAAEGDHGPRSEAEGGWRWPLWLGWQMAALRYRDAAWAVALIDAALALLTRLRGKDGAEAAAAVQQARVLVERLWPVLPYERQEAFILKALRGDNAVLHDQHVAAFLLALTRGAWSETLGRAVLRSLQARVRTSSPASPYQLRAELKQYARSMPPALAGEAAGGWERQTGWWSFWASAVDEFLTVLQFRHDMHAALARATLPSPKADL